MQLPQRNAVMLAIEHDRKYSNQKRKLMHHRNPSTELNLKKAPTFQSLRDKSSNMDFTNLMEIRLRTPKGQIVMPPPRIRTEAAHPNMSSLRLAHHTSDKKSRCSSASSHNSTKLRLRYNEMQRIRQDNERIVEKILLAKPTLQNRKDHNQFFSRHKEISKRLSRYSHASPQHKRTSIKRHFSPKNRDQSLRDIMLPDLPRKRTSFRQYFPAKYNYERPKGYNNSQLHQ